MSWNASVKATCQRLRDERLTLDAKGCTEGEIIALEANTGGPFPAAYRHFLGEVGRDWGRFMVGSDVALGDLLRINGEARELVAEAGTTLPPSAFVFLMHQGHEFLCFFSGQGDDPPVHRFMEGEGLKALGISFSEWLWLAADDEIRIWKRLNAESGA